MYMYIACVPLSCRIYSVHIISKLTFLDLSQKEQEYNTIAVWCLARNCMIPAEILCEVLSKSHRDFFCWVSSSINDNQSMKLVQVGGLWNLLQLSYIVWEWCPAVTMLAQCRNAIIVVVHLFAPKRHGPQVRVRSGCIEYEIAVIGNFHGPFHPGLCLQYFSTCILCLTYVLECHCLPKLLRFLDPS